MPSSLGLVRGPTGGATAREHEQSEAFGRSRGPEGTGHHQEVHSGCRQAQAGQQLE